MVMIFESTIPCGTAPSCQHWQMPSCSVSSKVVLHCLAKSGESHHCLAGLPEAKLPMALLSSSTNGSESNSSMMGRQLMTSMAAEDTVFSLESRSE